MAISSTSRKSGPYSCNGINTSFSFDFKVFEASDLLVVSTDLSGAETNLIKDTDYTVTLNADQNVSPGGSITTTSVHASGFKVTITTQLPATQEVTIPNGGAFYPEVVNDALDRLTILLQQVQEKVDRCIKTAISSDASPDAMLDAISQAVSDAETAAAAAEAAAGAFGGVGVLAISYGGTGAATAGDARTALGLGSVATKTAGTGAGQVPTAEQIPGLVPTSASLLGAFRNLQASANGASANVSVSADELVVENASNAYQTLRSVSLTINTAGSGANGLDTGTLAGSTWYALWVIWNGTTTAGMISLSATAPTLPSGYTHKARVGWIRTDASGSKYPLSFKQSGRKVQYAAVTGSNVATLPTMASGTAGTVTSTTITWVSVAVANFVPTTAAGIKVVLSNGGGSYAHAAPNNTFGGQSHTSNPSPVNAANGTAMVISGEFLLESSNIYWASNAAGCFLNCFGWEDSL